MNLTAELPPSISQDPLRQRVLGLLSAGVSQSSTALACGVSDGYITQLLADPEFSAALADGRAEKVEAAIKHDTKIEDVEAKALKAIEAKIPFIRSATEAAKVFQTLNNAKKRAVTGVQEQTGGAGVQQVNIILPRAAAVAIQMNTTNQVVEVSGRSMATLPSRALPSLVAQKMEERDTERAAEILAQVPLRTMINGVPKLL